MNPSKVLVIEDFKRIRELFEYFFIKKGFVVSLAATGAEGIKLAQREKPQLVLLDLKLPDLDGTEILRRIRAFDKSVKIFILSGSFYTEEQEKEIIELGATALFNKSSGIEVIVKAVCDALSF